jgi:hypothetical protein
MLRDDVVNKVLDEAQDFGIADSDGRGVCTGVPEPEFLVENLPNIGSDYACGPADHDEFRLLQFREIVLFLRHGGAGMRQGAAGRACRQFQTLVRPHAKRNATV